jgi:hypothetical protein
MFDELIRQAIASRSIVACRYNGQRRIGEPHLYGVAKGRPTLLFYQTEGSGMFGPYPVWRRFTVDDIVRFTVTSRTFSQTRLNPDGDRGEWDEVWAVVAD